jgi:hypothetical protein
MKYPSTVSALSKSNGVGKYELFKLTIFSSSAYLNLDSI